MEKYSARPISKISIERMGTILNSDCFWECSFSSNQNLSSGTLDTHGKKKKKMYCKAIILLCLLSIHSRRDSEMTNLEKIVILIWEDNKSNNFPIIDHLGLFWITVHEY